MSKPYVICHMGSTVDGRIITEHWGKNKSKYSSIYEDCHKTFESEAWMVGRVTMEKDFTEGQKPALVKASSPMKREAFIGDESATSFAIAVDAHGKLGWDENEIDGDHIIEVLSESVSDDYLYYLQSKKVSYIFAGTEKIDFALTLSQLHDRFKIKTLMLEGGGHINGSLLSEGLVDEISLLILPLADGTAGTPTTFEMSNIAAGRKANQLKLLHVQQMEQDVIWIKYKVV